MDVRSLCELLKAIRQEGRAIEGVEVVPQNTKWPYDNDKLQVLFHTTSPAAARGIAHDGFDLGRLRSRAFGEGVNLGRTTEQALLYADPAGSSCTLVCVVAAGRTHRNLSVPVQGSKDTVPLYLHPKQGFNSMSGAGGTILVVADPGRVRPVFIVRHTCKK